MVRKTGTQSRIRIWQTNKEVESFEHSLLAGRSGLCEGENPLGQGVVHVLHVPPLGTPKAHHRKGGEGWSGAVAVVPPWSQVCCCSIAPTLVTALLLWQWYHTALVMCRCTTLLWRCAGVPHWCFAVVVVPHWSGADVPQRTAQESPRCHVSLCGPSWSGGRHGYRCG